MKVSRMEIIPLAVPLEYPFFDSVAMETIHPVVVRLYTDDGLDSFGVCFTFFRPGSLVACIEDLRDLVIGAEVMYAENTWQKLFQAIKPMGRKGFALFALSAIDTALWGIRAKAAGVPLSHLLGGFQNRVPAYASFLLWRDRSLDQLQKEGALLIEKGFSMIKLKMGGRTVSEERTRLKALRESVGKDTAIMIDANWRWSVKEATQIGRMLEEENVFWLEDPLSTEDPSPLAQVSSALVIPVATGENFSTKYEFRNLIEKKSCDIFIIDLQSVGGVTEWMKVAAMAQAWNIPVASHIFPNISVHLTAAIPNCLCLEYMPWWNKIFANPLEPKNGYLHVPESPGLGVELDKEVLQKYKLS